MPTRVFQYDVFLLHNRAQKDWTRTLARRLRDDGFIVWFDEWALPKFAGMDWTTLFQEAFEQSRKTVLILSPDFLSNDWLNFDAKQIQNYEPGRRGERIIPLVQTKCELPLELSFIQSLDFTSAPTGTVEFEFRYHQLLHNLDNSRPFESDFERFKSQFGKQQVDVGGLPPVSPLPRGSHMPYAPNPLFVGREAELQELARCLTPGVGSMVGVRAAVVGMGGVGKTQLVIEYAHRYGRRYPGGVFWISLARSEDTLNEVARCGSSEGVDVHGFDQMTPPEQASLVRRSWEDGVPRLLIFDNAEDPANVEKWRPKTGACSVLITSRRGEWPPEMGVRPLHLETFPRSTSLDLLFEVRPTLRAESEEQEAAEKLCEYLGDLPLALTVVAAYLRKYRNERVSDYLRALSRQPVLQDPSLSTVLACFAVSYKKLDRENQTDPLAILLFHLASQFAPASIARELLTSAAGLDHNERESRHRADDSLARLQELGLIKGESDGRLFLHPLLREFARQQLPPGLNVEHSLAVARTLLRFAREENASGLPQNLARERAHLRHIAAELEHTEPELASSLYSSLGFNAEMLAMFQEAKDDHEWALKIDEDTLGPEHPNVARDLIGLGRVLHDLGDLDAAKASYERALKIDEAAFSPEHPTLARDLLSLGRVLGDLGNLRAAKACYERALKIDEAAHGPDHPSVAIGANSLGLVLRALGDLAGAKARFERALKIDEAVSGPDHPNTARSINNLGLVLKELGDLHAAKTFFERALRIDEAVYGPNHPSVATRINNLGLVLKKLGDLDTAKSCFERALKIDEAVYGPNHPSVATRINNLGLVFQGLDDPDAAKACFERAVKIVEAAYGPDHPRVATHLRNLGRVAHILGDHVRAEACFSRAAKIDGRAYEHEEPKLATDRHVKKQHTAAGPEESQIIVLSSVGDIEFRAELTNRLSLLKQQGAIRSWIQKTVGNPSVQESAIAGAQLVLILVSQEFLNSGYCYAVPFATALAMQKEQTTRLLPIIVSPCDWTLSPIGKLSPLPNGGRPISKWLQPETAWNEIVDTIKYFCKKGTAPPLQEARQENKMDSAVLKADLKLFEVFVKSGVPDVTFVEPPEFRKLLIALSTPGRGVVIEGPSGIGKTTALRKAIESLSRDSAMPPSAKLGFKILTARDPDHVALLTTISEWHSGIVAIDDFHRLQGPQKRQILDYLKILADRDDSGRKLIIIGIPGSGQTLVDIANDIATRIDFFRLSRVPVNTVARMISIGERALNIHFDNNDEIAVAAAGSLNIAQYFCFHICECAGVLQRQAESRIIKSDMDAARAEVTEVLARKFGETVRRFVAMGGPRDLTCLKLLKELCRTDDGTLFLEELRSTRPDLGASLGRFLTERWMDTLYADQPDSQSQLFLDSTNKVLVADDPQLTFYLTRLSFTAVARAAGKVNSDVVRVFVSYSHQNQEQLQRLQVHLKPLLREGIIDAWSDTRIAAGARWKEEIRVALEGATVAVLLLSADFMASDFIVEHELPVLLLRAREDGTKILPVSIGPCRLETSGLSEFQCINDPNNPLAGMKFVDQELVWQAVATEIEKAAQAR